MTDQQPAGWYPDPAQPGIQRYHDGDQWTDHTAHLAGPGGPIAERKGGVAKIVIPIVACFGVAVLLAVVALVVGGGQNEKAIERSAPVKAGNTTEGDSGTDHSGPSSAPESTSPEPIDPAGALASPYIQGNIEPAFGLGEPGALSVIAVGAPDGDSSTVAFVVRNNTNGPLYNIEATGRVTENGQLVGSGSSQGFEPAVLEPGHIGFGYIYADSGLSPTAAIEVTATGDRSRSDFYASIPLLIGQANLVNGEFSQQVVGEVTAEDVAVTGPVNVLVLCVDAGGTVGRSFLGYTDGDAPIDPGATATYSVDIYNAECPTFLVGSSGYDEG